MAQWEEIISKVVFLLFHVHTGKFHEYHVKTLVYIFDICVAISVKIHEKSTLDYVYSVFSRTKDA